MLNRNYLRAKMVESGYLTIEEGGKAIGLPPATMYRRMKNLDFNAMELEDAIIKFHIDDLSKLFTRLSK